VEGEAIRFGLLAVKNVGEGAIESIIDARSEGGSFRSLADFCGRIDLRLANKRVLESLAKVGGLNAFGHPAQVVAGLDDAIAAAQATQRDRITGQTSLFDVGADEAPALEKPLPQVSEEPVRRRLAWEKELLGLYLSDHPLGALADEIGRYVTAYSGDLHDESLDQQRVVIGGIVTGFRTIVTKSKQTMGIATLEDLQGTLEVIVFPRLYEQTMGTWTEGTILLVAGRVDHKGDETPLLADLVTEWDAATARGPEVFARDVAAADRPRGRGARPGAGGAGASNGNGNGNGNGRPPAPPGIRPSPSEVNGGSPEVPAGSPASAIGAAAPFVSPLRSGTASGPTAAPAPAMAVPNFAPAEPMPAYQEPAGAVLAGPERDDEPPLPDEARAPAAEAARATTTPVDAGPESVLHVRFSGAAGADRVVSAMETFRVLLRDRPGATRVILHVPASSGEALPMELRRGVAYDSELLAEIQRRLGSGLIDIHLG